MTKYISGEIFSSGRATLYKNPSDQTVWDLKNFHFSFSKFYYFQTGQSRGFAFIHFESQEDAKAAKEAMSDQEIDGRRIRVDFSITKRAHTPTPGVYMGRPT